MRTCEACQQSNPDDARFCLRCGEEFSGSSAEPSAEPAAAPSDAPESPSSETLTDEQYWRVLIGPGFCLQFRWSGGWSWKPAWDYYRRVFRRFHSGEGPRFAFTWNWAPFFIEPFLWFLYRKMYLFALVYLIGPIVSIALTGDFTVPVVWSVIGSASANYVYYWHLKDLFIKIKQQAGANSVACKQGMADAGGVQPYVLWLVAASILLKIVVFTGMLGEPPLEEDLPLPADGTGDRQLL